MKYKDQYVKFVENFSGREFGFFSGGVRPGSYRVTLKIKEASGRVISKYQETYRALPAQSNLRLDATFESLAQGERGLFQIENYGTIPAEYGYNYLLWDSAGNRLPSYSIFPNIGLRVEPGFGSECLSFKAPSNLPPGRYRIGYEVSDIVKGPQILKRYFEVVPASS